MPHKYLQGLLGVFILVLIVFFGVKTRNALEEYHSIGRAVRDRDLITVDGQGKVTATPDVARIQLGVRTDGQSVKEAQELNTKKMNDISTSLKGLGIAAEDMQTSRYQLSPKQEWRFGSSRMIGYTVSQQVTVTVRSFDRLGEILGKSGELGANQIGGIQFTIDDPGAARARARTKAIEDANKKAKELAAQLGLTIVRVVTFYENPDAASPRMYADAMLNGPKALGQDESAAVAPAPQIEAGSQDVLSTVSVTFEVR